MTNYWRSLSTHLYHQYKSKKGKNYMFLHTYTFATNPVPLIPEDLTLCRNLHCVQVKYNEKAPFGKVQKQRRKRSPTREQNMGQPTVGYPPQHQGLDLAGSPQHEGEDGSSHPRCGCTMGATAPSPLSPRPISCWWFSHQ
jgi:hypothetical protein